MLSFLGDEAAIRHEIPNYQNYQ